MSRSNTRLKEGRIPVTPNLLTLAQILRYQSSRCVAETSRDAVV
jgi:hypothetical protein